MSFDVLQDKIREMKNPTVAGLDARIEYVPEHIRKAAYEQYGVGLKGAAEAIWQFNVALIDAMCDIVPAVKPQAAYYENLGWQGMEMLERTIAYAKEKGMFVIADIKRGDIGSTATAYAEGWLSGAPIEGQLFKSFDADCVTLNGYMGSDSIKPFLKAAKEEDKCAFVLVKTSNPGSGELQDLMICCTHPLRIVCRDCGTVYNQINILGNVIGIMAYIHLYTHIAKLFREVIEQEYPGQFAKICFAILEDHNSKRQDNPEGNYLPFYNEFMS